MIGDRWGVSDAEVERSYPCDAYVDSPVLKAWRGVTVHTSAERLWPWVAQVRLAPYSYDRIDNLGRRSPQRLVDLADPVPGESFTRAAGVRIGRILSAQPPAELTGQIAGIYISYILEEQAGHASTRLLMKLVAGRGRLWAPALCLGDLVMARRQLLNFKHLAEHG